MTGDTVYHLPWAFRAQAMSRLGEMLIGAHLFRWP